MNFKKMAFALTLSASFGLMVACNDDSSSSPAAPSNDDTPVSSSSVTEGSSDAKGDVADDKTSSSSEADVQSSDSKGSSDVNSSESNTGSSSSVKVIDYRELTENCPTIGETVQISYHDKMISAVCDEYNEWMFNIDQLDEFLCDTEGETKDSVIAGETIKMVCQDRFWTPSEENKKCNTEGATKEWDIYDLAEAYPDYAEMVTYVFGDVSSATLVCTDGEWTIKEGPCADGFTKKMMGYSFICKDGEWIAKEDPCTDGDTREVMDYTFICKDGSWEMKMDPCTDGEKQVMMDLPMVCKDGEWILDLGDTFGGEN